MWVGLNVGGAGRGTSPSLGLAVAPSMFIPKWKSPIDPKVINIQWHHSKILLKLGIFTPKFMAPDPLKTETALLEITVGHRPFSNQFQYLTDQNSFCLDKFTVHFQWEAINIPVKSSNLLKTSDQFLNLISSTETVYFAPYLNALD